LAGSCKDIPDSLLVTNSIKDKADSFEYEINLIDYFKVVWKWKYFIVLGAVLPAMLVCLILLFSPKEYKVTYTYDIGLEEKSYEILLQRFYSAENLDKLAAKLKKTKLDESIKQLSEVNIQLEISGKLLSLTIVDRSQDNIQIISSIVRDNFEKVIPMYSVKEELGSAIAELKTKMANIGENKFDVELELESRKTVLTKLEKLAPADTSKISDGIIFQFDEISGNSEYLPLTYQIQATKSKIINLDETIRANQEKYNYYEDLLSLNKRLFDEVNDKASSDYSIQDFHSFLIYIVNEYEDKKSVHYLNAYIKKIENIISANVPIIDKPRIYLSKKGIVRKSAIVFVVLIVITTFAAFLFEVVPGKQGRAS